MEPRKDSMGTVMPSAKEYRDYRDYAEECIDWAKTARSDWERDTFLQMAKAWTKAEVVATEAAQSLPKPREHSDGVVP
jgi:hypothetical protein